MNHPFCFSLLITFSLCTSFVHSFLFFSSFCLPISRILFWLASSHKEGLRPGARLLPSQVGDWGLDTRVRSASSSEEYHVWCKCHKVTVSSVCGTECLHYCKMWLFFLLFVVQVNDPRESYLLCDQRQQQNRSTWYHCALWWSWTPPTWCKVSLHPQPQRHKGSPIQKLSQVTVCADPR